MRPMLYATLAMVAGALAYRSAGWLGVVIMAVGAAVITHVIWPWYAAWARRRGIKVDAP